MDDETIQAYIGVGSNIDPDTNIVRALDLLQLHVAVTACSTFCRTAPLGRPEQGAFLNGVWQIAATQSPRVLKFEILRGIEADLGRVRSGDKYAARPIDLDILLYDEAVIHEPDLTIPDPDIRTRCFLSVPLAELDPDLVLPDTGEPILSLIRPEAAAKLDPALDLTLRLQQMIASGRL